MSNVIRPEAWWREQSAEPSSAPLQGEGMPPNPPEPPMELSERVSKIEAVLPALSTREDMALQRADFAKEMGAMRVEFTREFGALRSEMHREFNLQAWRFFGIMLTFGVAMTAAMYFIVKNVR